MEKKNQFNSDAKIIIEIIGKDNIISATHCQTRLRLVLKDMKLVDIKAIDKLDSVKGTFTQSGQFQIIIGTDVSEFFVYFKEYAEIQKSSKEETKISAKEQQNRIQKMMTTFSEIFIPIIPVIVAGGMILAFRNLLEMDWSGDNSSAVANSYFAAQLNNWLWIPAQAIFWYLPVYIVWSMFDRKKKPPVLGIVIGIMLVMPGTLVNLYDVSGALGNYYVPHFYVGVNSSGDLSYYNNIDEIGSGITILGEFGGGVFSMEEIQNWTVIVDGNYLPVFNAIDSDNFDQVMSDAGINGAYEINGIFQAIDALDASYFTSYWPMSISYIGQVIPALMVGAFAIWFYDFIDRHTHSSIKYVWPPFITIIVVQIIAFGFIGPIGAAGGFTISYTFGWAFSNPIAKYFFGPIFGLVYPLLVVTGLHHTLNAVMLQLTASGNNYVFPMLALANVAQGAAVFGAVFLLKRDAKTKEQGTSAGITAWLGVTEPAMYGVNLRYIFPFVAAMIGSAIGATFVVGFGITANGIGMGGVLGLLNINGSIFNGIDWIGMPIYILIMIGTIIWTFALTILFSTKSDFFDKWATESWEGHILDINNELEKNVSMIQTSKYEKTFHDVNSPLYGEYIEKLDHLIKANMDKYFYEDEITHLKFDFRNLSSKEKDLRNRKIQINRDNMKMEKNNMTIYRKELKVMKQEQKKLNKKSKNVDNSKEE